MTSYAVESTRQAKQETTWLTTDRQVPEGLKIAVVMASRVFFGRRDHAPKPGGQRETSPRRACHHSTSAKEACRSGALPPITARAIAWAREGIPKQRGHKRECKLTFQVEQRRRWQMERLHDPLPGPPQTHLTPTSDPPQTHLRATSRRSERTSARPS